jgi:hypothetical protein
MVLFQMKTILSFASALLIIGLSLLSAQSAPPMMKAVVAHQWGGPEVLKLEDVPVPAPKENEMLIKVFAAGVNSFDGTLLSGKYAKTFGTQLPWIPGYDVAGTVEKIGAKAIKRPFRNRSSIASNKIQWAVPGLITANTSTSKLSTTGRVSGRRCVRRTQDGQGWRHGRLHAPSRSTNHWGEGGRISSLISSGSTKV